MDKSPELAFHDKLADMTHAAQELSDLFDKLSPEMQDVVERTYPEVLSFDFTEIVVGLTGWLAGIEGRE